MRSDSTVKDWARLLTDPDRDELARMIRVGQGVTWPKVRSGIVSERTPGLTGSLRCA